MKANLGLSQSAVYRISVQGCLEDRWAGWFEGMALVRDDDRRATELTGAVPDQAALHGLLARVRDLGLPLLSATRDPAEDGAGAGEPHSMIGEHRTR